jgi:multiple sugar transport system ATP-binding protein
MNFIDCQVDVAERHIYSQDKAWSMRLQPAQLDQISKQGARDYVAGIRAEDIDLIAQNEADSIPGSVYVIEPLGDRTLIDMRVGKNQIKVKVPPEFSTESGQSLYLRFDPRQLHIFDKASGAVVA